MYPDFASSEYPGGTELGDALAVLTAVKIEELRSSTLDDVDNRGCVSRIAR